MVLKIPWRIHLFIYNSFAAVQSASVGIEVDSTVPL